MRQDLVDALIYPKTMILEIIEERRCPHEKVFDPGKELCQQCSIGSECHWVTWLEECSDLAGKPTHTLSASLRYALKFVRSSRDDALHDEDSCECEKCTWIRSSEALIAAFEATLPPNRYRELN